MRTNLFISLCVKSMVGTISDSLHRKGGCYKGKTHSLFSHKVGLIHASPTVKPQFFSGCGSVNDWE